MNRDSGPSPSHPGIPPEPSGQTPFVPRKVPSRRAPRVLLLLIPAGIILLLAGAGGYWFMRHRQPATPAAAGNTTSSSQTAGQPTLPATTPADTATSQYVSNGSDLNLSFAYPSNWTVAPSSNNNANDQPITVTSPIVTIPSSNGSTAAKIVITIHPGNTTLSELTSEKATAAQASVQFAYTHPTSTQHQYPYLTFVHLNGSANPSGLFEEVLITGVTSFAKGQAILAESVTQIDPLITARFYQCGSSSCGDTTMTPLSISNDTWQSDATCQQVQAVFMSLQLH